MNALLERLRAIKAIKARQLISFAAYSTFFFIAFVLCCYWSFPYGRVRDYLVTVINKELGYHATIADLSPHWLTGVRLTEVKLTKPAEDANSEPTNFTIEEATVRASMLSLLLGNVSVSFWASTGDGEAKGTFEPGEAESFVMEAELTDLDLGALGVGGWIGLPVRGLATGTIALTMPEVVAESTGALQLNIAGLSLGDGKAKLKLPGVPGLGNGITIERINAGTLDLNIVTDKGLATIKQLSAQGPDLKLKGEGSLRLARPFMRSRGDFVIAATFDAKYKERNDRTKAIFQILDFQPEIKRAMSDDGTITFNLAGTLQAIRATPGAAPSATEPARKTRTKRRARGT